MFDSMAKTFVPHLARGDLKNQGNDVDRLLGNVSYRFAESEGDKADAWQNAANQFIDWAEQAYPGHKLIQGVKLGFDDDDITHGVFPYPGSLFGSILSRLIRNFQT